MKETEAEETEERKEERIEKDPTNATLGRRVTRKVE